MNLEKPINVTHIKTGRSYKIVGFAKNATNANEGDILVIYKMRTEHRNVTFARSHDEFIRKFEILDNKTFEKEFLNFLNCLYVCPKPTVSDNIK